MLTRFNCFKDSLSQVLSNYTHAFRFKNRIFCPLIDKIFLKGSVIFNVRYRITTFETIKRRLCNIEIPTLNYLGHLAKEKGEQQGTNMAPIHISVRHNNNFMITNFIDIKIF